VANSARGGNGARNAPAPAPTTYDDFAATYSPLFTKVGEPLEADHWLRVMESKFGPLRCTEVQNTLFTAQQLRGNASAWLGRSGSGMWQANTSKVVASSLAG
jgi:hypothetical protein